MNKFYTHENGEYLANNPTWHSEDSKWKANHILNMIETNKICPKSIIEVGCGVGEILTCLHNSMPNNVEFIGYDIAPDAIKIAKHKETKRLTFKNEDFLCSTEKADILLFIDVIEHIDDYFNFLRKCKNRAEYKIFHIPLEITVQGILRNILMKNWNSFGHLHFFTKETAIETLKHAGYEIVDFFFTAVLVDLPFDSFKSKTAVIPRKILFKLNKELAAKTLGGFSLMLLTK